MTPEQFTANLGRFDADPQVKHHFSDREYAKQFTVKAGHAALGHKHAYSHLSILAEGTASIEVDGIHRVHKAPACVVIEAGKHHAIHAVTDCVWFCVHATEEKDPANVDAVLIERGG